MSGWLFLTLASMVTAPAAIADVFEYRPGGEVIEHKTEKLNAEYATRRSPIVTKRALNPAHRLYLPIVANESVKHSVPINLILAVIQAESNWNEEAYSSDKDGNALAFGLMQLTTDTAERFGLMEDHMVWRPETNIAAGTEYLSWLIDRYDGNYQLAVAAYNAGEGNVDKHSGVPPFAETEGFVKRVEAYYGAPLDGPASTINIAAPGSSITKTSNAPTVFLVYDAKPAVAETAENLSGGEPSSSEGSDEGEP